MSEDQTDTVAPGLTKLTVNLTPNAAAALHAAAEIMDDTKTDTVNLAVMLYAQLVQGGIRSYYKRTVRFAWPDWDADETLRIAVRSRPRRWWQRW